MGAGKTLTALNILKYYNGKYIIVGNDATKTAFTNDIKKIGLDPQSF